MDIWCIGVLTYELLFASTPFEIRNYQDFGKIVDQELIYSDKVDISDRAKDFINRCMKKESYNRMSIRQTLEHAFLYQKN